MLFGFGGSEAHPTVAHDGGGDTVPTRGGDPRIPGDLRVVVRVHVDEAGGEQATVGIDGAGAHAAAARCFDGGDDVAVDRDVGVPAGRTAAIDQEGVANDEIVTHESIVAYWCKWPFDEIAVSWWNVRSP